jgi:hypothetical protein
MGPVPAGNDWSVCVRGCVCECVCVSECVNIFLPRIWEIEGSEKRQRVKCR